MTTHTDVLQALLDADRAVQHLEQTFDACGLRGSGREDFIEIKLRLLDLTDRLYPNFPAHGDQSQHHG